MNTLLFFGSFNPIHKGHLSLIKYIANNNIGDDLWIIVSPQNPFKDTSTLAPFDHRLEMVRLAVENIPDSHIVVSDIENHLPKPSYTINTLKKLLTLYPDRRFTILAGSDIADSISKWYKYDELIQIADIMIYPRHENDRHKASQIFRDAPVLECCSTDFRISGNYSMLPENIAKYIKDHNLYGL